jgi:hypothetical protein
LLISTIRDAVDPLRVPRPNLDIVYEQKAHPFAISDRDLAATFRLPVGGKARDCLLQLEVEIRVDRLGGVRKRPSPRLVLIGFHGG